VVIKVCRRFVAGFLFNLGELLLSFLVELSEAPVFGGVVDVKVHVD